ncbi:GNAT family N-acetyltransferase [Natrinema salifodinae]|uniref:Acetyltransferase (GNAT) domain-containing protein n=1 Tax=Natrinema salifodinae TaxID=1202768 RepID=A0A1I0PLC4_9EURY|nr:GNAT family N-acetyltransferase [Natrinema salifodinae]SEW15051.1 Acetyltransferase (GNAT) domain-containing protein [Natrinema salifodinae]
MSPQTRTATRYTVRTFEPGDRETFLSLYDSVFGRDRSAEWFRWKFRENPYVDHVPIVVATADGEPVGFRSLFAQEMRAGETVLPAFQPCDTMVHPEHRGRGLFDRMNTRAVERYADGAPSFFFNFPNEHSKRGNEKHGWREIGTVPAYYRPQNPLGALERVTDIVPTPTGDGSEAGGTEPQSFDEQAAAATATVTDTIENAVATSHRAGDRLLADSDSDLAIERYETPPADTLAAVYRRAVPDAIHTNRTADFYRWRFANPAQSYTTYVARRDDEPVAALVVSGVGDHARIVETVPRAVESERAALDRLLVAALDDYADRGYLEAFGATLPAPLRFRFYPDTRFPLSALLQPAARTLFARDLEDGLELESSAIDAWSFSRLDLDTT